MVCGWVGETGDLRYGILSFQMLVLCRMGDWFTNRTPPPNGLRPETAKTATGFLLNTAWIRRRKIDCGEKLGGLKSRQYRRYMSNMSCILSTSVLFLFVISRHCQLLMRDLAGSITYK
jgi:hypothetical protein